MGTGVLSLGAQWQVRGQVKECKEQYLCPCAMMFDDVLGLYLWTSEGRAVAVHVTTTQWLRRFMFMFMYIEPTKRTLFALTISFNYIVFDMFRTTQMFNLRKTCTCSIMVIFHAFVFQSGQCQDVFDTVSNAQRHWPDWFYGRMKKYHKTACRSLCGTWWHTRRNQFSSFA